MDRFPVLTIISKILVWVGWITVIAGILVIAATMEGTPPVFRETMLSLLVAAALMANGLIVVALGEGVSVLFSIERNTHEAAQALQTTGLFRDE